MYHTTPQRSLTDLSFTFMSDISQSPPSTGTCLSFHVLTVLNPIISSLNQLRFNVPWKFLPYALLFYLIINFQNKKSEKHGYSERNRSFSNIW